MNEILNPYPISHSNPERWSDELVGIVHGFSSRGDQVPEALLKSEFKKAISQGRGNELSGIIDEVARYWTLTGEQHNQILTLLHSVQKENQG